MKRNYRNLFMVGVCAFLGIFASCDEQPIETPDLPGGEVVDSVPTDTVVAVDTVKFSVANVYSTSAAFKVKSSELDSVAYYVHEGAASVEEMDLIVLYATAMEEGRVATLVDDSCAFSIYSLEANTEYTAFVVYTEDDQFVAQSTTFTTGCYDRIINVVESAKDGWKFHFEVPDTMLYMYAFLSTEWYNSARAQFGYNDLIFLMDGKLLKGPQTVEIHNGDYWNEDYDPEWDSPWYIHPGSAYTVLMAECDAEGNLLYEENPNYDPWGGDVWGPMAPATRVGTTEAPRMGEYSEEAWFNDDMYPTGVYARQNLLAALKMVDSKINVELVGKTERRIKVRCTTDDDTQYIIAPMMEAQYNDFVNLVTEDAVASTLLEYYGSEVQCGTQEFEFDENTIWVEIDSTYVISVVGVYAEDASVISFDTLHVTLTKSTLPAAEVTITGVESNDPNFVWFNIKSEAKNVYAAKHISNYTKEVQKMINDGNTYEDLIASYGEYLSEEDVQAINSDEGLNISIYSMDDMESTLLIGAFNEEEGMTVYTGVSRSAELPVLPEAPVYNELASSLKGEWTARIIQQKSEYSWETFEYTYYVDTTYTTLTLGENFDNSPEVFDENHEAYSNVYDSHYVNAIEHGATEGEAEAYAKEQVAAQFAEYKALASKYENKYKNQNYILGLGLADAHTFATPWDLFCASNYVAYDVEELFYAYGPKLFFQVQQDGSLYLLGDANIMVLPPVAAWGYYEFVVVGNNPANENNPYNGAFPVEKVDDDTYLIKGVDNNGEMCYPAIGYWSWGWLSYQYQTMADIQLTRGAVVEDEEENEVVEPARAAAKANQNKASKITTKRIKRTYLPTEVVKAKTSEMKYIPVLENVQEKFNKYNERLSK